MAERVRFLLDGRLLKVQDRRRQTRSHVLARRGILDGHARRGARELFADGTYGALEETIDYFELNADFSRGEK